MSSTFTCEITTAIPAPRLFKAVYLDWSNLAPKLVPDKVLSVVKIEGDGIGVVKQINYGPGMPYSYEQRRLDFEDVENCEIKSTVVAGGGLGVFFESASYNLKLSPSGTGSLVKLIAKYTPMPGVNSAEYENLLKGFLHGLVKACVDFLVANPDAYN